MAPANGVAGAQSFKVTDGKSASMSAADRTAQEEFLRKVSRLYRAVYGATRTADDVQSRLKQIREALRETPAVESNSGLRQIHSEHRIAKFCAPYVGTEKLPSGVNRSLLDRGSR